MIIPPEVQCKTCAKVFCCAVCRQKHEDVSHQEDAMMRRICYICNHKPFPLRKDTKITPNNLLVNHIMKEHLPLRCNRCLKVFQSAADLQDVSQCFIASEKATSDQDNVCRLEKDSKEKQPTTSSGVEDETDNKENSLGEAQPMAVQLPVEATEEMKDGLLTPLTLINLRWKRKSRQSFDSLLCTTNNLSEVVNGSGVVKIDPLPNGASPRKKKLVRSTSTPMYRLQVAPVKHPNESYTGIGQMSSIHCSTSSESDGRTEDDASVASPISQELDKVRAIARSRSKMAATPLRQVMSKSIQRAIAQHGHYKKLVQPGTQRKMSFSSTTSSTGMNNSTIESPGKIPLDLRTTPVLKRSTSDSGSSSRVTVRVASGSTVTQMLESAASVGTLKNTSDQQSEYYDAHQHSVSLLMNDTACQENLDNSLRQQEADAPSVKHVPSYCQETPKVSGSLMKKTISFTGTFEETNRTGENDTEVDVWGTPCAIPPRSLSCSVLGQNSINLEDDIGSQASDDVFFPESKDTEQASAKPEASSRLWSIVSNVIRLASRSDVQEEVTNGASANTGGLVQRAASFADYLKMRYTAARRQTSSSGSEEYNFRDRYATKRRRTASLYTRAYTPATLMPLKPPISSPVAKRKRIQGRQPINRLRNAMNNDA